MGIGFGDEVGGEDKTRFFSFSSPPLATVPGATAELDLAFAHCHPLGGASGEAGASTTRDIAGGVTGGGVVFINGS